VEVKGKLHKELGITRFGSQLVVKPLSQQGKSDLFATLAAVY